jgi:hypothetical protein
MAPVNNSKRAARTLRDGMSYACCPWVIELPISQSEVRMTCLMEECCECSRQNHCPI